MGWYLLWVVCVIGLIAVYVFVSAKPKTAETKIADQALRDVLAEPWLSADQRLHRDARRAGLRALCESKGHGYRFPETREYVGLDGTVSTYTDDGSCVFTKETCNAMSNQSWTPCTPFTQYVIDDGDIPCTGTCTPLRSDGTACTRSPYDGDCMWRDAATPGRPVCDPQAWYDQNRCAVKNGGTTDDGQPCSVAQPPSLHWVDLPDGTGKCVQSSVVPILRQAVCTKKGFGFSQGTPVCDAKGYCIAGTGAAAPACDIPRSYCTAKGLEYRVRNGAGECYQPLWQGIIEDASSTTVVRQYKKAVNNLVDECKNDPFGPSCLKAMSALRTLPTEIVVDTSVAILADYLTGVRDTCNERVLDYTQPSNLLKCALAAWPAMYQRRIAIKIADQMINGLLGWIPGVPSNMLQYVDDAALKYSLYAIDMMVRIGVAEAVRAFEIGGDHMYRAILLVPDWTTTQLRALARNVEMHGKEVLSVLMNVADIIGTSKAITVFTRDLPVQAVAVFRVMLNAPAACAAFFESVAADARDVAVAFVAVLKDAISAVRVAGVAYAGYVRVLLRRIAELAIELEALAEFFIDIGNHIDAVFTDVGDAFVDVGQFFKRLF